LGLIVGMGCLPGCAGKSGGGPLGQDVADVGSGVDVRRSDRVSLPDWPADVVVGDSAVEVRQADLGPGESLGGDEARLVDLPSPDAAPEEVGQPDVPVDGAEGPPDLLEPADVAYDSHQSGGVWGRVTLMQGNCMPPSPPDCAQMLFPAGDIFFVNVDSEESFFTTSSDTGEYEVSLPDGEYYVWPDMGWDKGYIPKECWLDLAQCSEDEYAFVKGDFAYMEGQKVCSDDSLWQSHDRCNVLIQGIAFQLDLTIDNIAY